MDEEKNNKDEENQEEIVVEDNLDEGNFDFQEKIKKLKEDLGKCREEKQEYLNGWQRAKADLINARKDDERRNQEFLKFANASLVSAILPVLDSLELAFTDNEFSPTVTSANKQDSRFSKGIFLIKMQLEDILKRYGLEPIKSIGAKADFNLHEIVGETESEKEEGIIIEELQKGYIFYGKILRPARVKISKTSKTKF